MCKDTKLKKCMLIIDSSYIKVHMHATGAKNGNQDIGRAKWGSIRKFIWLQMPKEELLKLWSPIEQKQTVKLPLP